MTSLPSESLTEVLARIDDDAPEGARVEVQRHDGVAIVVLRNSARRNALTLEMWRQLGDAFIGLRATSGISAIVIRGEGREAFAAGADITEFATLRSDIESAAVYNAQIARALDAIANVGAPTIAAIRGFAVGGGCELSHACDLRLAAADARLGIPIGKLGVILGPTEAKYLVRQIGVAGLKRVLLSAELFDAEQSLAMRLVDQVVPVDELWDAVGALVATIERSRPVTVRSSVLVANHAGGDIPSAEFAEQATVLNNIAYGTAGLAEGYSAFLEKRPADFTGEKRYF